MDVAPNALDPITRAAMEQAYCTMLSAIVDLARALGKPCPVKSRDERRQEREQYSRPS